MINTAKNLRIFFKKYGRAKYISHLDMNRCLQRTFRRAEIPVWHTQGFNPHIYMTFAMPLSLGFESYDESVDIKLDGDMTNDEIVNRLNKALPVGIEVTKVCEPTMKPEKIAYAEYQIALFFDDVSKAILAEKFDKYINSEQIITTKKSKKGLLEVDIKPLFNVIDYSCEDNLLKFHSNIAAGINLNINPTLIINSFCDDFNLEISHYAIIKLKHFTENGENFI